MTSFAIQNFGCRVNQAEAFAWAEIFERHGLELEKSPERADIVIVNTCTLTSQADREGRKFIRRIERQNPRARLVLTGCAVEAERQAFEKNSRAWLVLSNREKESLAQKVMAGLPERPEKSYQPLRSRALLKVQDGCDGHCTFCVIPRVRGRSRSLELRGVLDQSRRLIEQGFREIVVCGIHLSSYGRDLNPPRSLLELLRELIGVEGLGRIRLSSLDPTLLEEELLDFLTVNPKICPHFHISLQHASDRMLARMGRRARVEDYETILSFLCQKSPEAAVGADILVGFPGETEEDFEAAYAFLARSPLAYLHVFSYSPRPGTAAAHWPQVPEKMKKARSARLRNLSQAKRQVFYAKFLGRELEGIVIRKAEGEAEVLTGNYLKVRCPASGQAPGQAVRVRITGIGSGVVQEEVSG